MAALRIEMLGGFRVAFRGNTVSTVNTTRLRSLLAYLVLKSGAAQSRQYLSFLFWPDSSEAQARTNLRQLLHHLRSALPDCEAYLETGSRTLCWRDDADFSSDVGEFERAAATNADSGGEIVSAELRDGLENAVRLYRGDLLPGFYDEWVQAERQVLRQHYLAICFRLTTSFEKTREYPDAISFGERLLSCDPLSEANYQRLIRLHALNGDRAGALRAYHECVSVLRRELNVEPGIATRKLHEELARLNPAPGETQVSVTPATASSPPLVGRQKELDQILQCWRSAVRGRALFLLVLGESGIGKTRLAEEAMNRAGPGTAVYARCYAAERDLAYAPVTHWLRSELIRSRVAVLPESELSELVRVAPELLRDRPELSPPQPLAEAWHRRRFLEVLARAVINPAQPILLVLDDLQWCDSQTLEWLEFLMQFDPGAKVLVLGTARIEELGEDNALRPILNRLIRDDSASEIVLSALDREETAALARHVSRRQLDEQSLAGIYGETEGNPLFVVETVLAGFRVSGELAPGPDARLSPKVRAVLASRLAQLSAPAREVAGVAAAIGRAFRFELLLHASTFREADLISLVDELWERRIIRRAGQGLYDFSHDKLREEAYQELRPGRRDLLHRAIAETLEAEGAEGAGAQVASHYEQAGMPARAVPHLISAAKWSRGRYADREAVQSLTRALEVLALLPQTSKRDEQELEILVLLGAALVSSKGYAAPEVGRVYDRGRLLCEFLRAREPYFPVLWGSWVFHVVRANFATAREFASRFSVLANDCGNTTLVAAGHFMTGCTLFHIGGAAQARPEFLHALDCYDPEHHPFLLHEYGPELGVFCQAYLAHCLWVLGYPQQALDRISSALTRARDLGGPFSVALALVYSAMLHQFAGNPGQALDLAEQAAALCEQHGFIYYQAWPPIITGWAMSASGQAAEGAAMIAGGIDSFRRIQSRLREPYYLGLLAEASIAAGHAHEAMKHVRAALTAIEEGGEIWAEAEIHRIKGDLLRDQGDARGAEMSYQRAYSVASRQQAGWNALRAAISLARFWTTQGQRPQAQKLLRDLRDRFAGQADAPDLTELDSLLAPAKRQQQRRSPD